MKANNDKYKDLSKKELIEYIEGMEEAINNMESEKSNVELLKFPWIGNLGNWSWIVKSNKVIFNEKKATNLGYEGEEIPENIGFEFFTNKLHPDDHRGVMKNMSDHLRGLSDAFEVEYRILKKDGNYAWYYDRGKVTKRDKNGQAILVSGIVFDISKNKAIEKELKETNKRLHQLAITDELTSAFNRRYIYKRLDDEIERCARTSSNFSLIMIDIDNFKDINDSYGHNIGDKALIKIAEVIMKRIRKIDVLARIGGDEFMILLPETKRNDAAILAEDILKILNKTSVYEIDSIEASMGVVEYNNSICLNENIKKADDLMYLAKKDGRNCVRC